MNPIRALFSRASIMSVLAVMIATLGLSTVSVVTATSAEAATSTTFSRAYGVWMPAGTGRPYGGWVGTFKGRAPTGEYHIGPCVDRNLGMATAKDIVTTTSLLPGANTDESRRMRFLANKYGTTASNTTAKRLALAVWIIQDSTMKTYMSQMKTKGYLSSADVSAVNTMLSESERHGPYTVSLSGSAVGVTKAGSASIKVRSYHGYYPPAGGVVSFTISKNAVITSVNGVAGKTSGSISTSGYAKVAYKVIGAGKVTIAAKVSYPHSGSVHINVRSSTSTQRIIGGNLKETASANFAFEKKVGAPTYTSACSTNCDGTATVTVKVCNDAANSPVKHAVMNNGVVIGYVDVAAGACASKTFSVKDASVLTSKYCHTATTGGACTTGWTSVAGSFEVVCPAWATAEITVGCNCATSWASVKFTAPAGSTRYYTGRVVLSSNGVVVGTLPTVKVAAGQSVVVPISMQVSAGLVIEARFSAYKDSALTQSLVSDATLTKVMVLQVAGSAVTYQKSVVEGGTVVSKTTSTATISK